jgi:ligand-binding sensor domain-containing protein
MRMEQESLHGQPIYRIEVDPDVVWMGGELGIFRVERETGSVTLLGNEGGIGGPAWAMHSTPTELWVGRYTGVEVIDKASMEHRGYPSQSHLRGADIYAIYAEGDLVWVGTNNGLWKYDRKRNYWHRYTEEDGLLDKRVYALYPDGDYILIGTAEGVTRFLWNVPERID